ncbi:MAG: cell wall assembly protein, partial [Gammaproteobacteria bacterium]|nr:cell wall assembly protein [Gammaproteobacteria bacterium]
FCLKESTGEIVALNDDREVLCKWASIKDFKSCLSEREIEYDDRPQIDSSLLSPDYFEKSNGWKKKH